MLLNIPAKIDATTLHDFTVSKIIIVRSQNAAHDIIVHIFNVEKRYSCHI